jgi:putative transposase
MKEQRQQAVKIRIYPTKEQQVLINKHFGCARFVFNYFLNQKKEGYLQFGRSPTKNICSAQLPAMKKTEEFEWLKEVNSQTLQAELEHLEVAYNNFFKKKSGFPKFKSKHNDINSFKVPQSASIDLESKTIKIPKFEPIKFKHRLKQTEVEPNSAVISRNRIGQYYASVQFEGEIEIKESTGECIGIDLGLTHFLIDSNGTKIDNPRLLKKQLGKIKYLQRMHSKKKKGSKSKEKQRIKLSKKHNDVTNKRKDFQNKLSTKIISENQVICLEDLNIKGMTKNHKLAQAITDVAWSSFVNMLKYKGMWHNRNVVFVDRWFPSSKTCSSCNWICDEMRLDVREWICPKCGCNHDRDINAAKNILRQGLNELSGCGAQSDIKQKLEEVSCSKIESMSPEAYVSLAHR